MVATQRFCHPPSHHAICWPAMLVLGVLLVFLGACSSNSRRWEPVYFPQPPAQPRVVFLRSFNQLADLVVPSAGFMEVLGGASPSPFVSTPAGMAYARGHLYICDTDLDVVHDWDLATGKANILGRRRRRPRQAGRRCGRW